MSCIYGLLHLGLVMMSWSIGVALIVVVSLVVGMAQVKVLMWTRTLPP